MACAKSVPVTPIATPTSAVLSAGPSLMPSPVIATTWPRCCSARTISSFIAGLVRAKPLARSAMSSSASACSGSRPASTTCSPAARPMRSATARAVPSWSPVIISGRMPAARKRAIIAGSSGRSGSARPTRPSQHSPPVSP